MRSFLLMKYPKRNMRMIVPTTPKLMTEDTQEWNAPRGLTMPNGLESIKLANLLLSIKADGIRFIRSEPR